MTVGEKKSLLETYAEGPKRVEDLLAGLTPEVLHFRPSVAGAWTIAEHLNHLLDSEANAFIRYRKAVAEPGQPIATYDQEGWQARLGYDHQYCRSSLEAFALLRKVTVDHLSTIIDQDWSRYYYEHPENGKVTLEDWLKIYADHVRAHMEYIDRNLRLFSEERAGSGASAR